jgi:two-component system, LuxR family, sensor kinase FixL
MGVGLSISRTIIEAHGGEIRAEDNPGGGAIFRFTCPPFPQQEVQHAG